MLSSTLVGSASCSLPSQPPLLTDIAPSAARSLATDDEYIYIAIALYACRAITYRPIVGANHRVLWLPYELPLTLVPSDSTTLRYT